MTVILSIGDHVTVINIPLWLMLIVVLLLLVRAGLDVWNALLDRRLRKLSERRQ